MATKEVFFAFLNSEKIEIPISEFKFHPSRGWLFDYYWTSKRVALEVEGGIFGIGKPCSSCGRKRAAGHTSIERLLGDMEKYNEAAILNIKVVRVIPDNLLKVSTINLLKRLGL